MHDRTGDRCSGTNRDGGPCAAPCRPGRPWCAFHDPDVRERIAAGRVQGGRDKSNARRARKHLPAEPMTAAEVHAYLGVVFKG